MLPLLHGEASASQTALIDTILLITETTEHLTNLWLFSDLLETATVEPLALLADRPNVLFDAISRCGCLEGVAVDIAGVGRFHDRHRRRLEPGELQSLLGTWQLFVSACGGILDLREPKRIKVFSG
jgi:hypothetical protein